MIANQQCRPFDVEILRYAKTPLQVERYTAYGLAGSDVI
jgi:hypothetical protein